MTGVQRYVHRGLAEINGWESLPPVLHFVRTRSDFIGKTYGRGISGKRRTGADRRGSGPSGRNPDLRYQALPSVCGQPSGGKGRFCGRKKGLQTGSEFPQAVSGTDPGRKKDGADPDPGTGSKTFLPEGSIPDLRYGLCGNENPFPGRRRNTYCDGGRKIMKIYLAPMEGITGEVYRRAYHTFF